MGSRRYMVKSTIFRQAGVTVHGIVQVAGQETADRTHMQRTCTANVSHMPRTCTRIGAHARWQPTAAEPRTHMRAHMQQLPAHMHRAHACTCTRFNAHALWLGEVRRGGTARCCAVPHATAWHRGAPQGTAWHHTDNARHGTARHGGRRRGAAPPGTASHARPGQVRPRHRLGGAPRGASMHGRWRHRTARRDATRNFTGLQCAELHITVRRPAEPCRRVAAFRAARHGRASPGTAGHGTPRRETAPQSTGLHSAA